MEEIVLLTAFFVVVLFFPCCCPPPPPPPPPPPAHKPPPFFEKKQWSLDIRTYLQQMSDSRCNSCIDVKATICRYFCMILFQFSFHALTVLFSAVDISLSSPNACPAIIQPQSHGTTQTCAILCADACGCRLACFWGVCGSNGLPPGVDGVLSHDLKGHHRSTGYVVQQSTGGETRDLIQGGNQHGNNVWLRSLVWVH